MCRFVEPGTILHSVFTSFSCLLTEKSIVQKRLSLTARFQVLSHISHKCLWSFQQMESLSLAERGTNVVETAISFSQEEKGGP